MNKICACARLYHALVLLAGIEIIGREKLYINGGFGQIGFGRLGSLANGAQSNSILSGWALGTSY